MHPQKLNNIINLSPYDRYEYFIREVVKLERVWAVSTDDFWIRLVDYEEEEIFPLWPHQEVVEACFFDEFRKYEWKIECISLSDFLNGELIDLKKENIMLGVFYDQTKEGLAVTLDRLEKDILEEIQAYL